MLSRLEYLTRLNIGKLNVRLMGSHHKLLRFVTTGRYFALDLKRAKEPINTIFDVGANVGQSCLLYQKVFPKSTIYSFEPIADTYRELKINTEKYPNIHCVHAALGEQQQQIDLLLQQNSETNSLKVTSENNDAKHEVITVDTGANFCSANNIKEIDLLKLDTEGYELEVLNGFGADFLKNNVRFIYAEVGFDRADILKTHFADLESYLSNLGFITSGFYEPNRWAKKLKLGFCNVLFTNTGLVDIYG